MSDTPETDKLDDDMGDLSQDQGCDYRFMMRHARKMERERDEARKVATTYADAYGGAFDLPWENDKDQRP